MRPFHPERNSIQSAVNRLCAEQGLIVQVILPDYFSQCCCYQLLLIDFYAEDWALPFYDCLLTGLIRPDRLIINIVQRRFQANATRTLQPAIETTNRLRFIFSAWCLFKRKLNVRPYSFCRCNFGSAKGILNDSSKRLFSITLIICWSFNNLSCNKTRAHTVTSMSLPKCRAFRLSLCPYPSIANMLKTTWQPCGRFLNHFKQLGKV